MRSNRVSLRNALSVGADWTFRSGYTLSGSYTRAYSDTGNKVGEILDIDRYVTSDAMALGLMKENLFNNSDQLYFSISQPLRASSGSANLNYGDRYDENGILHYKEVDIDLVPSGREIDFQIGYVRNLSKALKLKTFLYHAEDYNHISANKNSGGMVRVEWEF